MIKESIIIDLDKKKIKKLRYSSEINQRMQILRVQETACSYLANFPVPI